MGTRGKELFALCQKLKILGPGKKPWHHVLLRQRRELKSFDAILLRKDPPFDANYLHHLLLLDLISKEVYMMNHPRGILLAGEKTLPLLYPEIVPDTLISSREDELMGFIQEHPKGTVLKPIGFSGGHGVYLVNGPKSLNLKVILESVTQDFSRFVIAQDFLPEVYRGDKRILLLGGKFLGAFLRKPAKGEHRANLHSGASAHPARLSARDKQIITILQPQLQELGLDFVGLDIIGGFLTEVNVTSPMGVAELRNTGQSGSEKAILDFIERRIQ
jgi:glutathione synthase